MSFSKFRYYDNTYNGFTVMTIPSKLNTGDITYDDIT